VFAVKALGMAVVKAEEGTAVAKAEEKVDGLVCLWREGWASRELINI
jgi:hypothetical protein